MKKCPSCGAQVADGEKLCPNCYTSISEDLPTVPVQYQEDAAYRGPSTSETAPYVRPRTTVDNPSFTTSSTGDGEPASVPYRTESGPWEKSSSASGSPHATSGYAQPVYRSTPYPPVAKSNDAGSWGWGVLGFFFPIIGFILFAAWHKDRPRNAKNAGIGGIFGFLVGIILGIVASHAMLSAFSEIFTNNARPAYTYEYDIQEKTDTWELPDVPDESQGDIQEDPPRREELPDSDSEYMPNEFTDENEGLVLGDYSKYTLGGRDAENGDLFRIFRLPLNLDKEMHFVITLSPYAADRSEPEDFHIACEGDVNPARDEVLKVSVSGEGEDAPTQFAAVWLDGKFYGEAMFSFSLEEPILMSEGDYFLDADCPVLDLESAWRPIKETQSAWNFGDDA